jgi:hypothetical protein
VILCVVHHRQAPSESVFFSQCYSLLCVIRPIITCRKTSYINLSLRPSNSLFLFSKCREKRSYWIVVEEFEAKFGNFLYTFLDITINNSTCRFARGTETRQSELWRLETPTVGYYYYYFLCLLIVPAQLLRYIKIHISKAFACFYYPNTVSAQLAIISCTCRSYAHTQHQRETKTHQQTIRHTHSIILSCNSVTIDGAWTDNRICWTHEVRNYNAVANSHTLIRTQVIIFSLN